MDVSAQTPANPRYLPAMIPMNGTVGHSARTVAIATVEAPDLVCGRALRVGYAGKRETDFALYRLRVKSHPDLAAITLPGLFVLENRLFHEYVPDPHQ